MKRFLIAGTAVLLAAPVLAQMAPPAPPSAPRAVMTEPQTRAQAEARIRERLGAMDADRNGTVTSEEMRALVAERMKERAAARFDAMDKDKNGSISRAEFDAHHSGVMARSMEGGPERRRTRVLMMQRGAGAMAWNGNGIVIDEAVKRALERFDAADTNKDGTLTPEERRAARESMRAKWRANRV